MRFRLLDVAKGEQLLGLAYIANSSQLRNVAHRIADAIYEKLTGDKGVFATRIAYVVKQRQPLRAAGRRCRRVRTRYRR